MKKIPDPITDCLLYKELGCAHVDGPLCDFPKCSMNIQYTLHHAFTPMLTINGKGVQENTVYVELITKVPDKLGRTRFDLYWLADNVGPKLNQIGLRGQTFFGDLQEHLKYWKDKNYEIEYVSTVKP